MFFSFRTASAALVLAGIMPAASAAGLSSDARASTWLGRMVRDQDGATVGRVSDVWLDLSRREPAVIMVARSGADTPVACRLGTGVIEPEGDAFVVRTRPPQRMAPCADSASDFTGDPRESVRTLVGAPIKSSDGDDVGTVKDVVLRAAEGRVHYLLADFASCWVQDGELTILPARPLRHERDNIWIRADLGELQRFPMVREERIDDVSAPSFSRAVDGYLAAAAPPR